MRPLALLLSFVLGACASGGAAVTDPAAGVQPFSARDLSGKTVNLGEHLGRDVVFLSFWATYCEPCKAEMPILQRFHDAYQKDGLTIVTIALDGPDTAAEVAPYIRKQGYTFPVVLDESGDIAQALNPSSTAPYAILLGRDGRVVRRITGFQPSEAPHLEAELKGLLGLAP